MQLKPIQFRDAPVRPTRKEWKKLSNLRRFFSPQEIEVAQELVQERLAKGVSSGYLFLFAEAEGRVVGYTCYGPIPCTVQSFDLYWIAVEQSLREARGREELLQEKRAGLGPGRGSRNLWRHPPANSIDRPGVFEACGYGEAAMLKDFYAPGGDKVIYLKVLP